MQSAKTFTSTYASAVKNFFDSQFADSPINCFKMVREFYDGGEFELTTDIAWHDHFIAKKYYQRTHTIDPVYIPQGVVIWDAWGDAHKHLEPVIEDAIQNFDGGRGVTLIKRGDGFVDKYSFSAPYRFTSICQDYVNQLDKLDRFVSEFKDVFAKSIDLGANCRRYFPTTFRVADRTNALSFPRGVLRVFEGESAPSLTPRELECLLWLSRGKSMVEIGMILQISSRTVEKFIASLKLKFNCVSLFQLGEKFHQYGLDKLLAHLAE